jgi:hypothetical protein
LNKSLRNSALIYIFIFIIIHSISFIEGFYSTNYFLVSSILSLVSLMTLFCVVAFSIFLIIDWVRYKKVTWNILFVLTPLLLPLNIKLPDFYVYGLTKNLKLVEASESINLLIQDEALESCNSAPSYVLSADKCSKYLKRKHAWLYKYDSSRILVNKNGNDSITIEYSNRQRDLRWMMFLSDGINPDDLHEYADSEIRKLNKNSWLIILDTNY